MSNLNNNVRSLALLKIIDAFCNVFESECKLISSLMQQFDNTRNPEFGRRAFYILMKIKKKIANFPNNIEFDLGEAGGRNGRQFKERKKQYELIITPNQIGKNVSFAKKLAKSLYNTILKINFDQSEYKPVIILFRIPRPDIVFDKPIEPRNYNKNTDVVISIDDLDYHPIFPKTKGDTLKFDMVIFIKKKIADIVLDKITNTSNNKTDDSDGYDLKEKYMCVCRLIEKLIGEYDMMTYIKGIEFWPDYEFKQVNRKSMSLLPDEIKLWKKRLNMYLSKNEELICNRCGYSENYLPQNMKQCSKCKKAFYCDKLCQKADWKIHKKICKSPKLTLSKNDNSKQEIYGDILDID